MPSPPPTSAGPTGPANPTPAEGCALVIVRLKPPPGATTESLRVVAERVRGLFVEMPGLRRKYFAYSAERHEVINVYDWENCAAAARVCHPEFVAKIRAAYAGEPDVTLAEILVVVDPSGIHRRT